jgi:hypothetical protein
MTNGAIIQKKKKKKKRKKATCSTGTTLASRSKRVGKESWRYTRILLQFIEIHKSTHMKHN